MQENWELHWKDYYKILQIDPSAEPETVRAAYNSLARKYHPDHVGGTQTTTRMVDLNEAYEVLSDLARKTMYDAAYLHIGNAWERQSGGQQGQSRRPTRPTIIGICGRSCSGKGVATSALSVANSELLLIQADWYFYPKPTCVYNGYTCLEHTNAVDLGRLARDLRSLRNGLSVTISVETSWLPQLSLSMSAQDMHKKRVIMVDGFLTFAVEELVKLFDYRIFVDASDSCIYNRRVHRDGNSNYIKDVVIPVSKEYDQLQKSNANVIIDGEQSKDKVVEDFVLALNKSGYCPSLNVDRQPWELHFGDLVQDTAWHSTNDLKDWVRKRDGDLRRGQELKGNTFRYRWNRTTGRYEVRMSTQYRLGTCRYERNDSSKW